MPPEIPADDESNALFIGDQDEDSENEIPARPPKGKDIEMADADEDEEDGDEGDDEEYVVEKIVAHKGKGKNIQFQVKWQGYEDLKDMTWEPRANLENANELVGKYEKAHGLAPEGPGDSKKRRISQAAASTPTSTKKEKPVKRARSSGVAPKEESPVKTEEIEQPRDRVMPKLKSQPGAWEDIIDHVETIEQVHNAKDGSLVLMCKVTFCDGLSPWKSSIQLERIRMGAPQKLLDYMIQHLSFRSGSAEPEADFGFEAQPEQLNGTS